MNKDLSVKQKMVFDILSDFNNYRIPTYRFIAKKVKSDVKYVFEIVRVLKKKGFLDKNSKPLIRLIPEREDDCVNPQYHERIQIRMVDEDCIKLFKEVFGGNYYRETEHSKYSKRPLYCYQAADKLAAGIIKILLPYLRIKSRQAKLISELRKSKESKGAWLRGSSRKVPMNPKIVEFRESLYQQIKRIHKGGDAI